MFPDENGRALARVREKFHDRRERRRQNGALVCEPTLAPVRLHSLRGQSETTNTPHVIAP